MEKTSKIPTCSPIKATAIPRPNANSSLGAIQPTSLLAPPTKRSLGPGVLRPQSPMKTPSITRSSTVGVTSTSKAASKIGSKTAVPSTKTTLSVKRPSTIARSPLAPLKTHSTVNRAPPTLPSVDEKSQIKRISTNTIRPTTTKLPANAKAVRSKKVRPSLSDRTIESLYRLPATPATDRRRSSFFNPESPIIETPSIPRNKSTMGRARATPQVCSKTLRTGLSRDRSSDTSALTLGPRLVPRRSISSTASSVSRPGSALSLGRFASRLQASSRNTTPDPDSGDDIHARFAKTSAALREQIARVKAHNLSPISDNHTAACQDPTSADVVGHTDVAAMICDQVRAGRSSGHLDLTGLRLSEITDEIRNMDNADCSAPGRSLTISSLTLANNQIGRLNEQDFPDCETDSPTDGIRKSVAAFSGLEKLDMRANILDSLPMGMRRLMHLTTLDLSHNMLGNSALEIVAQISGLKHLSVAHNRISGQLPVIMSKLTNLKTLDLSGNKLLSLPDSLREIRGLHVLNVSANQLTGLPMDALEALSLTELNASHNALVGALFSFSVTALPSLKSLDVSHNTLASLAFSENVSLPALQTLDVSDNRLITLPDMSSWTSLNLLDAHSNMISELPTGFTALSNLRQADFSNNALRQIDSRIASMKNLVALKLDDNPVHVSEMPIDIDGRSRHRHEMGDVHRCATPQNGRPSSNFSDEAIDVRSQSEVEHASPWKVTGVGRVSLESKGLEDSDADSLRAFFGGNDVRELSLASNLFTQIPFEICLAQSLRTLDLSRCAFENSYLTESVHLPSLQELSLASNEISCLQPLATYLRAESLNQLDMSHNKLTGKLPYLRGSFPHLSELVADDNQFDEVGVEALRGLDEVYLSRNKITRLQPEIGLLAFEGLRVLEVDGNEMQSPDAGILSQGTEATLEWLRGCIPGYQEPDTTY